MQERKLLFIGEKNSCSSQMAEGFARAAAPPGVRVMSAGLKRDEINPLAVKVMLEVGIDISKQAPKTIADLDTQLFDVVVVLSASVKEKHPVFQGIPASVFWNLPDPEKLGDRMDAYRQLRDRIKKLVSDLFEDGYFEALVTLKNNAELILDNLSEGIVAHDMHRRIFYFNRGAEKITGYRREEVLGRDCHDVFPGSFCGGKCSFREKGICRPVSPYTTYALDIVTKDGERKNLEMSVVPMRDSGGQMIGILASYRDQTRVRELESKLGEMRQFAGIIGRDHKMIQVFELIREVANTQVPVLIQGETGTGKELVAAAIHNESLRAGKPFVAVNCGALPEGTLESELFGHVKGAFTGAIRDKKGRFELADGGTIFLDEVGELPLSTQVKLLRVLQEGTFERVGGEKTIKVDVRVISATNRDLREMIAKGKFREDLYYRLCVVPITLPPLRERRNDIPLLAQHFLKRFATETGRQEIFLSDEALAALMDYDWPGNVRQLENAIRFALVKCRGKYIDPEHLPPEIFEGRRKLVKTRRKKLSAEAVQKALQEARGNKSRAAQILGVGRATLYRFLQEQR